MIINLLRRASIRTVSDLRYDTLSPLQTLDLYLPTTVEGELPLLVFIHGGGFAGCDKSDFQQDPWITLVDAGYAVASLNYRLSGTDPHPAGLTDCKTAVRFLKTHADEYGIDSKRVAVTGGSSGGHYALMVALTPGNPELEDLSRGYSEETSAVTCAAVVYSSTDLRLIMKDAFNAPVDALTGWKRHGARFAIANVGRYIGARITDPDDDALYRASPAAYIHEGMPPVLLQHGDRDELCPVNQSTSFYDRCKRAGIENIELDVLKGSGHGHPHDRFASARNMRRVRDFLDTYMKSETQYQQDG